MKLECSVLTEIWQVIRETARAASNEGKCQVRDVQLMTCGGLKGVVLHLVTVEADKTGRGWTAGAATMFH